MFKFRRIWSLYLLLICRFVNNDASSDALNEDISVLNLKDGINMTTTQDTINSVIQDEEERFIRVLIFEGLQFRASTSNKEKLWENGVVPYEISDDYSPDDKKVILDAMSVFHNETCVNFRPRRKESSHIFIMPGSGCSAFIGKVPNITNNVTLGDNCVTKGIVLHELMHSLGFIHEQNRSDRDEFVKILFDNIIEDTVKNFDKYAPDEIHTFNQTYDYDSVMHYGEFDFAKNKSNPTIIPLKDGVQIGQRVGFSDKDILKINLLYNCTKTNNTVKMENEDNTVKMENEDSEVQEEVEKEKDERKQYKMLKSLLKKIFRY